MTISIMTYDRFALLLNIVELYTYPPNLCFADVLMAKMPTMVAIPASQSGYSFDIMIRDEAFLQVGGHFLLELNSVKLIGGERL